MLYARIKHVFCIKVIQFVSWIDPSLGANVALTDSFLFLLNKIAPPQQEPRDLD